MLNEKERPPGRASKKLTLSTESGASVDALGDFKGNGPYSPARKKGRFRRCHRRDRGIEGMRHLQGLVLVVLGMAAGAFLSVAPAMAQECPGNPNALGTSRTIAVEPGSRVGVMQYPESLPLRDKEVVLTFDDGPLPPYSEQVLDILNAQCVKATFFLV